jgi:hypothetical protein
MTTATTTLADLTLDITQELEIKAAVGDVYRSMITRLTSEMTGGEDKPMPLVLEEWPGGRWFRDLGNQQGHLWGFVQVIKPPTLLEITGPMAMSYAAAGHIQLRLAQIADGTLLTMRHRVVGMIDPMHREGFGKGWGEILAGIKDRAEK